MNSALRMSEPPAERSPYRLRLVQGERPQSRWSINGFPATILTWTEDEWSRLTVHPGDAQQGPNGVWSALRLD